MQSSEIRSRFLEFFRKRGHAIIPSAPLVPENDPSVLFTTAGMQPLVPYLLGEKHPQGKRLANSQKCVRTGDLDDIGDNRHFSFFEMLGNWSLGDYFKKDAITWSYEFLTSKEEGLGLDPERLYVTVFEGDENAPRDEESPAVWKSLGIPESRIYFLSAEDNWWSPGENGPCGPDSEMFYDLTDKGLGELSKDEFLKAVKREDLVEIWNDVFMEYQKKDGKVVGKLEAQNVDTGAGLERLTAVMQKKKTAYDTDLFAPTMRHIKTLAKQSNERASRVVADHVRAAVFMITDGVMPSNTDQGYILRRLLRRAVRFSDVLGMPTGSLPTFVDPVVQVYEKAYPALKEKRDHVHGVILTEENKFRTTLKDGLKEFEKLKDKVISGEESFKLFTTYGFPFELLQELAKEHGMTVDVTQFEREMKKHQDLSRKGAEQKFKGGLADTSPKTTMLHTSTHLMLAALRKYLGTHVHQAGSNITIERTRFDFTHPEKVSREVLDKVEAYVNEAIQKKAQVSIEQTPKEKAKADGVEGSFWEKYPDTVNVYMVKAADGTIYSRELCGGPHVENTGTIEGTFKILKEEAVAQGVRRIKAVLE